MHRKEVLLREWYNLAGGPHASSKDLNLEPDLLLETESEQEDGGLLLQSDSEREASMSGSEDVLLATDSEDGHPLEPPSKIRRRYQPRSGREGLKFLGKAVCRYAHMRLYGVGSRSLQNLREGKRAFTMHEGRLREPKHPKLGISLTRSSGEQKWPNLLMFFWVLYVSCAEVLPVRFTVPTRGKLDEMILDDDPEFEERFVNNFMKTLHRNHDLNAAPG